MGPLARYQLLPWKLVTVGAFPSFNFTLTLSNKPLFLSQGACWLQQQTIHRLSQYRNLTNGADFMLILLALP